jgi:hypothetical protein
MFFQEHFVSFTLQNIFVTTVEVQFGYNNAEQRWTTSVSGDPVHSLWVSLVSPSLNPVTRGVMLGADFQGLTGHGTAHHFRFSVITGFKFM